jgi:hypothetical protein
VHLIPALFHLVGVDPLPISSMVSQILQAMHPFSHEIDYRFQLRRRAQE